MTVPVFSASIDLFCLFVFGAIKFIRYRSRKAETYSNRRDIIFSVLVVICFIDSLASLIVFEKQYITNIIRPIIVVLMYRTQQDFFNLVSLNIKDSFAMLLMILIWVLYFAAFGNFLF